MLNNSFAFQFVAAAVICLRIVLSLSFLRMRDPGNANIGYQIWFKTEVLYLFKTNEYEGIVLANEFSVNIPLLYI